MNAVDTNVLVRVLVRDDLKQTTRAEELIEQGAWVSHVVLAETVWVLESAYAVDPKRSAAAVEMLLNHSRLSIQEPSTVKSALEQFRAHPSVGFSDCLILESAKKAGNVPLATFDKQLAKLAGTIRL